MYVIARLDGGGGYVAREGSESSYTYQLQRARTWPTKEAAEQERCTGNEVVLSVEAAMGR